MSEDARKKFQTYLFFLRHFDRLIREKRDDSTVENLVNTLVGEQMGLLAGITAPSVTPGTMAAVKKMLFNAWNSETVARVNSLFDLDVRAITNQWKPIQTYYALYFLLAAIHELLIPGRQETHAATLKFATNMIPQRFPSPWCCRYNFDKRTCHGFQWTVLPAVNSGWNLANHDDPCMFIAHFYRTTGKEKRYERWLEHGKGRKHKPGHPRAGKAIRIVDTDGGMIGFWDVLWRMRKWVNYKEAHAMLEGQEFEPYVEEFDNTLNSILTASAAVVENLLYALIGDTAMTRMYDAYLGMTAGRVDCSALETRRNMICGLPW